MRAERLWLTLQCVRAVRALRPFYSGQLQDLVEAGASPGRGEGHDGDLLLCLHPPVNGASSTSGVTGWGNRWVLRKNRGDQDSNQRRARVMSGGLQRMRAKRLWLTLQCVRAVRALRPFYTGQLQDLVEAGASPGQGEGHMMETCFSVSIFPSMAPPSTSGVIGWGNRWVLRKNRGDQTSAGKTGMHVTGSFTVQSFHRLGLGPSSFSSKAALSSHLYIPNDKYHQQIQIGLRP